MARNGCLHLDFAAKSLDPGREVLSPKKRRVRLVLIALLAIAWSSALVVRLVSLQITSADVWRRWAAKQHTSEVTLASERGPLYDRHGRLLAVSVPAGSVWARPRLIKNRHETADKVARLLGIERRLVEQRLMQPKPFVWLKRQVPRAYAERVAALNLPGVGFFVEPKRYYPYNRAASALIGRVGIDGNGLSGIELLYENHLHAEHIETVEGRDALGHVIERLGSQVEKLEPPKGKPLALTIDAELQLIMDEELEAGQKNSNSKAVMGVMIDARSGEILAMGQSPSMNFNVLQAVPKEAMHNLLVETVFEPGSIMKPIVAAAALDAGVASPREVIFCENGRYSFGRHAIKDVHPYGDLTFFDVVVRSSNIGMTKVGSRLGRDRLHAALSRFGFGEMSQLRLPGETPGILRSPDRWALVDVATHSFGQGIAVTPLQMVRAVSAIANGGMLPELSLVEDGKNRPARRVLSERAAREVREMMYGVVEDEHGTGRKSEIEGIRVAGKTGTAQKPRPGGRGYEPGAYAASFVGFVDGSPIGVNRIIALLVIVDEPKAGTIYGGTLAAPVFQRIMQRSLHMLSAEVQLKETPLDGQRDPPDARIALMRPGRSSSWADSNRLF